MTTAITAEDRIRGAFRERARQAVEVIAASASTEALADALGASTDFGAVARALGSATIPRAALELDPLADALARGVQARAHLADQAGGLLSAVAIGQALGISRQAVDKRRRANQLLAVRLAGDWHYPATQIGADGQTPKFLAAVLDAGAAAGLTGWAMLDVLLAPDTALGGKTPLSILHQTDGDTASILRLLAAAQADSFG
jgi:hypothetical protein